MAHVHAGNYRHQADVSHAYHVLVNGGLEPDRIVVMMADDIAYSGYNPHLGRVFNCPGCPDVYAGTKIDYRGPDVNATNMLAVLAGNMQAVEGIGSGRVIASGPRDRVFVYYTDHGAAGQTSKPRAFACRCTSHTASVDGRSHRQRQRRPECMQGL